MPDWPNSHKLKIQDGGGRHLEFRKNVNNFGLDKDILHQIIWEDAARWRRDDHVTKSWNRKLIASISVTRTDIGTKFGTEHKYCPINTLEWPHSDKTKNPRWRRSPSWISENVNNSELDRAICAKIGLQMHHGHAEMRHGQKSKPELFCVTSLLWWIKMYILNKYREHNRCADVKAHKSSQLTNL